MEVTNNILFNSAAVGADKQLRMIQKEFLKNAKKSVKICFKKDKVQKKFCLKNRNVKALFGKVVKLKTEGESYIDLSSGAHTPSSSKCEMATSAFKTASSHFMANSRESVLSFIENQKILGMSGSCFPLAKKLESALSAKNFCPALHNQRVLVVNAVECEISLLHDAWLLRNRGDQIAQAVSLIASTGFDKVVIVTKPPVDVVKIGEYDVTYVAPSYPMGSEHVLVRELFGFEVPTSEIPADYGIAVVNIQTVFSFYESVITSKPVEGRFITVADLTGSSNVKECKKSAEIGNAVVVYARYGMRITEVFDKAFGSDINSRVLITGGGLLFGHRVIDDEVVSAETCFIGRVNQVTKFDNNAKCKGCMKCSRSCPMGLKVTKITHNVRVGDVEKAKLFEPEKCIQCGTCSFVCKASKNLMENVKIAKEAQ